MKFRLYRTSDWERGLNIIEINTLKELLKLVDEVNGEIIIGSKHEFYRGKENKGKYDYELEIYDCYRE